MENKINVAQLLKDCPNGMELDCTMFENVTFEGIKQDEQDEYPIIVKIKEPSITLSLTKTGGWNLYNSAKCIIFPKGKTTWEGFIPHNKFNDGDVLYVDCADKESDGDVYKYIFILKEIDSLDNYFSYCHLSIDGFFPSSQYLTDNRYTPRLATEEEKQKLFDAIKDNGYKWNQETKTLEKLIEPKFKVGDRIKYKVLKSNINTITKVCENHYELDNGFVLKLDCQDDYELVPNKFDITTLIPFESRVLIRDNESQKWYPAIWGVYDPETYFPYKLIGCISNCCIPYEGNEHLINTVNDCNEYYKTWK